MAPVADAQSKGVRSFEEGFEFIAGGVVKKYGFGPALAGAEDLFSNGSKAAAEDHEAVQAQLYEQIGRLKMELDWVKKKVASLG